MSFSKCWLTAARWRSGWSRWRERRGRRRPRKPQTWSPPVWSTAGGERRARRHFNVWQHKTRPELEHLIFVHLHWKASVSYGGNTVNTALKSSHVIIKRLQARLGRSDLRLNDTGFQRPILILQISYEICLLKCILCHKCITFDEDFFYSVVIMNCDQDTVCTEVDTLQLKHLTVSSI